MPVLRQLTTCGELAIANTGSESLILVFFYILSTETGRGGAGQAGTAGSSSSFAGLLPHPKILLFWQFS